MTRSAAGRLLSVNVGLPRDVTWDGRTVHTGIWKEPVEGRRMVRRLNVDGDGQGDTAGHGGPNRAVFVYQIESYRYWERELGRDDFAFGQFGENFTVEGLADDEVCVGDRYRVGSALFEVSAPRVTCYRVGIRMREPRMPSLLVAHRRPGFYFRVLEEGEVRAGESIERVERGPEAMTVAEVDGLLYLPGRARRDLVRALRIPALSEGWQGSFRELLEQAQDGETAAPAWTGMRPMRVTAIERESATVISVRLAPVDGEPVVPAQPGQFLTVRLRPDLGAAPLLRTYSLSGLPSAESYRISVKREPHGAASGYLHGRLGVGDVVEAGAPRGSFVLRPGDRPVVLVSAGVGATPVLAMLHALAGERPARRVWWLHGARNRAEHAFQREAAVLLAQLPAARSIVCYSRPGPDDAGFDVAGRLGADVLDEAGVPADADFYLCGPGRFMRDLAAALTARGTAPERISTEVFGPLDAITPGVADAPARAPHAPSGAPGTGPSVWFSRSNLSVAWDPSFASLLELAEACDVPVRWACRTGVCHTCESGLVSGEVRYRPDPLAPPAPGTALICCSQPRGEVALDL
ncbi:MAG TPA: MOSC and FAD-binding oxidoreductase domain-containing protein [Solirubrobacteraceae bacterium]|nr:MOSC and FAD-binding oxidoreductase domain-containing protein [Solirubrobacteraceae bacterium]